ncbi:putative transcription factor Hap3/NF-YB family [Helianthus debilis subsp. tardiflorus]
MTMIIKEVCSKEDRKTIAPEHVLKALQSLREIRDSESYTRWFSVLGNYIEDVYVAYEQHKLEIMVLVFKPNTYAIIKMLIIRLFGW